MFLIVFRFVESFLVDPKHAPHMRENHTKIGQRNNVIQVGSEM